MQRPLTSYEKELAQIMGERYKKAKPAELVLELCRIGVIDYQLSKVLAVRQFVDKQVKQGNRKVKAMVAAAQHFCSTYEYVRKCVYYYKNINIQ